MSAQSDCYCFRNLFHNLKLAKENCNLTTDRLEQVKFNSFEEFIDLSERNGFDLL